MSEEVDVPHFIEVEDFVIPDMTRDAREVERKHEVGFTGDTNGSLHGYLKNLLKLGYIEIFYKESVRIFSIDDLEDTPESIAAFFASTDIRWTKDDTYHVALGDKLADRTASGIHIVKVDDELREQAELKRGKHICITGNHDVYMMLLLAGYTFSQLKNQMALFRIDGYADFIDHIETEIKTLGTKELIFESVIFNLQALYQNPTMVQHIEQIKRNFCLAAVIDDTLFLHADVMPEDFIKCYTQYETECAALVGKHPTAAEVIDSINDLFHQSLEKAFPIRKTEQGKQVDMESQDTRLFHTLTEKNGVISIFSGFNNRRFFGKKEKPHNYPPEFLTFLRSKGINALVFGHERVSITEQNLDFTVVPADGGSNHQGKNELYSCGKITKKGSIFGHIGLTENVYRDMLAS